MRKHETNDQTTRTDLVNEVNSDIRILAERILSHGLPKAEDATWATLSTAVYLRRLLAEAAAFTGNLHMMEAKKWGIEY